VFLAVSERKKDKKHGRRKREQAL
jgi:hypothetical protein